MITKGLEPVYLVILFDLDGTLQMSLEQKAENAGRLWQELYGVPRVEATRLFRKYSGLPRRKVFEGIAREALKLELTDADFVLLSERFTKFNVAAFRSMAFVPGTEELLVSLVLAGTTMAVSTSATQEEVEARLAGRQESRFFRAILGSRGEFHKGKPHAEYLSELTGLPVSKMLMVGDDAHDLHLAREAGMQIALVAQTSPLEDLRALKPDILAPTLAELQQLLFR